MNYWWYIWGDNSQSLIFLVEAIRHVILVCSSFLGLHALFIKLIIWLGKVSKLFFTERTMRWHCYNLSVDFDYRFIFTIFKFCCFDSWIGLSLIVEIFLHIIFIFSKDEVSLLLTNWTILIVTILMDLDSRLRHKSCIREWDHRISIWFLELLRQLITKLLLLHMFFTAFDNTIFPVFVSTFWAFHACQSVSILMLELWLNRILDLHSFMRSASSILWSSNIWRTMHLITRRTHLQKVLWLLLSVCFDLAPLSVALILASVHAIFSNASLLL